MEESRRVLHVWPESAHEGSITHKEMRVRVEISGHALMLSPQGLVMTQGPGLVSHCTQK